MSQIGPVVMRIHGSGNYVTLDDETPEFASFGFTSDINKATVWSSVHAAASTLQKRAITMNNTLEVIFERKELIQPQPQYKGVPI